MDKENLIIRLSTQIDTIKAHVNRLKKSGYSVHSLDVDMLRNKTIEFYELVFELENIINKNVKPEKVVISDTEPSVVTSPVSEVKIKDVEIDREESVLIEESEIIEKRVVIEKTEVTEPVVPIDTKAVVEPIIIQSPPKEEVLEPIIPEPVISPTTSDEKEIETIVDEISEDKEMDQIQPQQTTYDLFSGNSESLVGEKYQVSDEQSIAERMQKSTITNIREAIGINEKFLFINELFNGDLGRYNKILDDINELPTKKGVDTYLLELKIQFQWADENEAYIKLKELLDRKFS